MAWIKVAEKLPREGMLVYTKNKEGVVSAHMRSGTGWESLVANTEDEIVEWFLQEPENRDDVDRIESMRSAFTTGYLRGVITGTILALIVATLIVLIF